jgi:hypothetical protein
MPQPSPSKCAICEADLTAEVEPEEVDIEDRLICRKCIEAGVMRLPDDGVIALADLNRDNPQ